MPARDSRGLLTLRCETHGESAIVAVARNPFIAITDAEGRFTLPEVPPGRYTLSATTSLGIGTSREVVVEAGPVAPVDIRIRWWGVVR